MSEDALTMNDVGENVENMNKAGALLDVHVDYHDPSQSTTTKILALVHELAERNRELERRIDLMEFPLK